MEKKIDLLFLVSFAFIVLTSFLTQEIYAATTKYGTLIIFLTLCLMTFHWIRKSMPTAAGFLKNKADSAELLILIAADLVAAANLFILKSNKGAWLIVADLTLLLFLSSRIKLQDRTLRIAMLIGSCLMLPWYSFVRWEYNFNMAGLVFMTLMICGEIYLDYMRLKLDLPYIKYVQIMLFLGTLLLTICYHARGAIVCVLIYGLLALNAIKITESKLLFWILNMTATLGSILFTVLYTLLGSQGFNLRILYKDVISGREGIWSELWGAFLESPLTGIGSSYKIRSFFIFEVHNGLFDILAVHGILVFILCCILLIRRLSLINNLKLRFYPDKRLAFAGIYTYLFASFYENCFIVPPYSMVFLALLLICSD